MRTTITELWKLSITIWKQQNTEVHGTDSAISLEKWRKETALEAERVYNETIGKVSQTDSIIFHHTRIEVILKWTKEHLDAYLASVDVILEQWDEPS